MFNSPEPKKEVKPKSQSLMQSIAFCRFIDDKGVPPANKEELVAWVKEKYGDTVVMS